MNQLAHPTYDFFLSANKAKTHLFWTNFWGKNIGKGILLHSVRGGMANLFAQLVKITIQKLGLNHLTKFRFEGKESKNQSHLNSLNPQFFLNFAKLKNLYLSILFQIIAEIVQIQFQYLFILELLDT